MLLRREFQKIKTAQKKIVGRFFIISALPNRFGHLRLGITVTRKYGGAVFRNKIKRRIREIFRTLPQEGGTDVHVFPRHFAKNASFQDLHAEFVSAIREF